MMGTLSRILLCMRTQEVARMALDIGGIQYEVHGRATSLYAWYHALKFPNKLLLLKSTLHWQSESLQCI